MNSRPYLIAYDISDTRDRRQALRLLRAHAEGYQDSFFEIAARGTETRALLRDLHPLLQNSGDRLLCLRLEQLADSWQLGQGPALPQGTQLVFA